MYNKNLANISGFTYLLFVIAIVESESEPEDIAAKVLRPLLYQLWRRHGSCGGDEQRAAACDEDALQV